MRQLGRTNSGIGLLVLLLPFLAVATDQSHDQHAQHNQPAQLDQHAQHKQAMQSSAMKVEKASYAIPDVMLTDEEGESVQLRDVLADDRPLAINFIFTSCTTICPVMTATMLQLQRELSEDAVTPMYVSISIDPDYDTATVMKSYAAKYGADWTFLTGSHHDVMQVLQSFDAYRGSKINHFALTVMRADDDAEWTRVEGLTSAQMLASIWRRISS